MITDDQRLAAFIATLQADRESCAGPGLYASDKVWRLLDAYLAASCLEAQEQIAAMRAALIVSHEALANCYDVTNWPADGSTSQDDAIRAIDAALSTSPAEDGELIPVRTTPGRFRS